MMSFENRSPRGGPDSNRIAGKNTRAVKAFRRAITADRSRRQQVLWCGATHADVSKFHGLAFHFSVTSLARSDSLPGARSRRGNPALEPTGSKSHGPSHAVQVLATRSKSWEDKALREQVGAKSRHSSRSTTKQCET